MNTGVILGSIFGFGIGFAVLTAAWATSLSATETAPQNNELRVRITELRNDKGMVHACLTGDPAYFPDCTGDPHALKLSVPSQQASELRFYHVPAGTYALSVVHDENGNGKLDTFAKIPREGFGFSRNPRIRFGPPTFSETSFKVSAGDNLLEVRVRYLL